MAITQLRYTLTGANARHLPSLERGNPLLKAMPGTYRSVQEDGVNLEVLVREMHIYC